MQEVHNGTVVARLGGALGLERQFNPAHRTRGRQTLIASVRRIIRAFRSDAIVAVDNRMRRAAAELYKPRSPASGYKV